jgi:hypothetical protein
MEYQLNRRYVNLIERQNDRLWFGLITDEIWRFGTRFAHQDLYVQYYSREITIWNKRYFFVFYVFGINCAQRERQERE